MRILLSLIITMAFCYNTYAEDVMTQNNGNSCTEVQPKDALLYGWEPWDPYQVEKMTTAGPVLTGMDIEIVRAIMDKMHLGLSMTKVPWKQHLQEIESGMLDMASGANFTDERAKYAYFSIPYRFESYSLFTLRDAQNKLSFANIQEFLAQVRLQNYRIGVVRSVVYGSDEINNFIKDPANKDIIIVVADEVAQLQSLIRGDIDSFITSRVTGASTVMASHAGDIVQETLLNVQSPVHLMLSKKTIPLDVVEQINSTIASFVPSEEYKAIVKNYLYPTLLLQTIGSDWFYLLGIIGTIAFAMSGVMIAAKDNATLFSTMLFAFLPSMGGGVMRDVMLNREQIGLFLNPSYILYVLIIILLGFATIKLLSKYSGDNENSIISNIWSHALVICDAVGQACFIVIGVVIAIVGHIEPIEIWGPFFAFLTANGGGILRDCLRKNSDIMCLSGEIDAEVSIIWGLVFAMFLSSISSNPDPDTIKYAVYAVVTGSVATRLAAYYYKIPNLRFK